MYLFAVFSFSEKDKYVVIKVVEILKTQWGSSILGNLQARLLKLLITEWITPAELIKDFFSVLGN